MLDLTPFADPWEHIRLLSDARRNDAILALLHRHAKGARVAEVGCGTGLWSVVAAALGAEHVYAIEPTATAEVARALVAANGLEARVTVLEDRIEDLSPQPVDLLFSELLNADPFAEGVCEAMQAGARWLAPGARMAPHTLEVFAAAIGPDASAREASTVSAQLTAWSAALGLDLDPLAELVEAPEPYVFVGEAAALVGPPVRLWSLALGRDPTPEDPVEVVLPVHEGASAHGLVVWFEATLDEGIGMANRPGAPGHWAQWVASFARPIHRPAAPGVAVGVEIDDGALAVSLG